MDVFFSDFDSYSESSSSSEDQENDEFMYGGQASSILSNLEDTIGKIDDFLSFERGYVEGDIVCSVADPSGQTGKVINVEKVVDLENIYGNKLKNIDSRKLQRVRSISTGDYVVAGPWVGKAGRIVDCVTVWFDDGTKFKCTTMDDEKLIPLSSDPFDDPQLPYFPGQRVKVVRSSIFKSTRWLCGTHRDEEQDEGTVYAVDAGFVYVNWLGCAQFDLEAPPSLQSSQHLTSLSCFSHSNWQLGDWCFMSNLCSGSQEIFVIVKTKTKVDVLWQDGSESWGLDSVSLGPVNILDAHDFWPHQFVLEKGTSDDQENKKWGVVKIVDSKEKTVKVKWETCSQKEENGIEEIVSAYELTEHPDFSYCLGDVVFGLEKGEKSCLIGIVIGFIDGGVQVKWAAGFTSKVAPNDIFRMDKCEGKLATSLLDDENTEPNQEKSERDDLALNLKAKDLPDFTDDGKDCFKSLCDSKTFDVPRAAIGFLSNVAACLFGSPTYTSLSPTSGQGSFDSEEESVVSLETYKEAMIKENDDVSKHVSSSSSSKNLQLEKFEMVSDCSTHHFVDRAGKGLISNQVKRGWLKKVQQEWNILLKDLPASIYVRVFEERMDLLQAAIVGAPGTPYHDGLFFFDIFLPPEYPQEPPMVHYISGGLRLNPNLYESGRVCLSLLNTWAGTGSETWNPNGSTILQVLLSLQALVLNQNPYFNEAGYDQQVGSVEGEKNSCSYNENAFLMSCKSIIYTLRKPPKHFEALVEEHFRRRCTYILMACKAYVQGVPIGYAFKGEYTEPIGQTKSSTGFKIALSKLFPKLVEAFSIKGFDCADHMEM
ncbi:probable ubiquitin-conjugating enzyme E2 24 [Cynara cardunculus var. scolymus]|uniref:probable ubiquitin-conjugating enzyme E2 24 n=1 Tax=Cynara cardunculus var. scolymus TaxID=59895 RepID=UPI000D627BFC|nr:probable ubiquitin-conjugating enzyme E2 24 [Cynara cardunculus var. scolymus]